MFIGFQVWYLWGLFPGRTSRSENWLRHYAPVLISTFATRLLQAIFCYTPWMQEIFGTKPLSVAHILDVFLASCAMFLWLKVERQLGIFMQESKKNGSANP